MAHNSEFFLVLLAGTLALVCTLALERLIKPRPNFLRQREAFLIHLGLVFLVFCVFLLLTARPWCSFCGVVALYVTLVLVNNTKMHTLQEPFVAQDYEYFLDTLRFPRLFLPFFGLKNFFQAALFFVIALGGLLLEPPLEGLQLGGYWGALVIFLIIAGMSLDYALRHRLPVTFDPKKDMVSFGLVPSIFTYALATRTLPHVEGSVFTKALHAKKQKSLPHLIAVQSESFFDPRPLFPKINPSVLENFDQLCTQSVQHGNLLVPAWGANTVRTEFAFLSGLPQEDLGVHRFNPYRMLGRGFMVPSLSQFLQELGYATLCIHPYAGEYYQRKSIFTSWGFDQFIDIRNFVGAQRFGPYVADFEVGQSIMSELKQAQRPVFVFAITMENHGPLHLEQVSREEEQRIYHSPPSSDLKELTVYLRHLRNADQMLAGLQEYLQSISTPASLCWFGDHVPIMPKVYAQAQGDIGATNYVLWNNDSLGKRVDFFEELSVKSRAAHVLASDWMQKAGVQY